MTSIDCDAVSFKETNKISHKGHSVPSLRNCVLAILLTVSVVLNVLLAHRLSQLNSLPLQGRRLAQPTLHAGVAVPPIKAKRTHGQTDTIVYSETRQPTVLYVFSPECMWCARNLSNIKALLAAKGGEDRFIGISLSELGLNSYLTIHQLNMPVYTGLSPETVKAYQLGSTPQTLVVSPAGRVLQNWPGAWNDRVRSQVEAYFHVKLPGLDNTGSVPEVQQGQL